MSLYKLNAGWTKERMLEVLLTRNTNLVCRRFGYPAYSNSVGNHCGIGCFIPDEHAAHRSTVGVSAILKRWPELVELMPLDDNVAGVASQGLNHLQKIHDEWRSTEAAPTVHDAFRLFVEGMVQ